MLSTLNLDEAARFLKIHRETLRRRAKAGEIPGAKIGRSWVFIESDLESHIRSQYAVNWRAIQGNEPKEVQKWPCIVEKKKARTGLTYYPRWRKSTNNYWDKRQGSRTTIP